MSGTCSMHGKTTIYKVVFWVVCHVDLETVFLRNVSIWCYNSQDEHQYFHCCENQKSCNCTHHLGRIASSGRQLRQSWHSQIYNIKKGTGYECDDDP
jgi:hypothetical protein